MRLVALIMSACLLAACAPKATANAPAKATSSPIASPSPIQPSPTPQPSASSQPSHVFVIVMENRTYNQVISNGYISQLAAQYGVATDYHGVSHPSLPNYLAMTSGSTWGIADDGFHALPAGGLGGQLNAAGIEWRAYMEGMTNGCFHSPYPYALKHNPFAYYGSACPSQIVPFSQFAADLSGSFPRFAWITPDECHNGHDCSNAVSDAWLSRTVPSILASTAWKDNGVLLITWDEGEDSANSVLTLVIRPNPLLHRSAQPYDHYSLLATIEDQFGLARLGLATQATPMNDLLATATDRTRHPQPQLTADLLKRPRDSMLRPSPSSE
ncbi:MAG: alkaline phosphatase family protein [Candidatus Dormibacteraeota bacterium]|nr:alkaline phosphatase family protein [Candidatus Dormibacteraeota bacterium]